MKYFLVALCALLAPSLAWAQGAVQQTGPVTPGHVPYWAQDHLIGDGGAANGGKIKELGITNSGTPLCINDAPTSGPYHQLCLGANVNGNGGEITYTPFGGAAVLPFNCVINGVAYPNCLQSTSGTTGGTGGLGATGNVKSAPCNAVGDGVTDDTLHIQTCIDLVAAGGGIVYIPKGHYCIKTGPLTNSAAAVTLLGESRQGSAYSVVAENLGQGTVLDACGADKSIISLSGNHNTIRSLHILGSNHPHTTFPTISFLSGCSECTIDDSTVQLGSYALNSLDAYEIYLLNSTFDTTYGQYIIYLRGTGGYIQRAKIDQGWPAGTPSGFVPAPAAWAANSVYAVKALAVTNGYTIQAMTAGTSGTSAPAVQPYGVNMPDNTVTWQITGASTYYGIGVDTASGGNLYIENSDFSNTNTDTIVVSNTQAGAAPNYITIINNTFANYLVNGIALAAGYGLIINGNTFGQCLQTLCTSISAFSAFYGNLVISGNQIEGQQGTAIYIGAGERSTISGNTIGSGVTAISIGPDVHDFNINGNMIGDAVFGPTANSIIVATGGSDYYSIVGNSCHGSTGVSDGGTGTHKTLLNGAC